MRYKLGLFRLLLGLLLATSANQVWAAETVIYMAPAGSDNRDGTSPENAVQSLQRALKIAGVINDPAVLRVKIAVANGVYRAQTVTTSGLSGGKELVIAANDPKTGRPKFDGAGEGGTWFILKSADGKPSRITIDGLEISNYVTAISLNGARTSEHASNSENTISNNIFRNIGQIAYPAGKLSTAALRLVNSDNNTIIHNRFENIRNITRCGALHSIYLAHYSTDNLIADNVFDGGCGATIKVRDAADRNIIRNNEFIAQQTEATFLDSYCNRDKRRDCTKDGAECPSWGNVYLNNLVEMQGAASNLLPVRFETGTAPAGCSEPAANMLRVKETGTRVVP